jgi:ribosomal protein L30E
MIYYISAKKNRSKFEAMLTEKEIQSILTALQETKEVFKGIERTLISAPKSKSLPSSVLAQSITDNIREKIISSHKDQKEKLTQKEKEKLNEIIKNDPILTFLSEVENKYTKMTSSPSQNINWLNKKIKHYQTLSDIKILNQHEQEI